METRFHRQVQSVLNSILSEYDSISQELADDFYEEFLNGVEKASANPGFFHFDASGLRRCNLDRFPFHFLYDIRTNVIRIWVIRHNRRNPSFGLRRLKP